MPISKNTLDFSRIANLLDLNDISQICYCDEISLKSAAVFLTAYTFGGNIYTARYGTYITALFTSKHLK